MAICKYPQMSPFRTFSQALIAVFSMVAVMLGALEHESLLLQGDTPGITASAEGDAGRLHADTAAGKHWTKAGADTGTEGTFRSETQVFWTAPAGDFFVLWRVPELSTAFAATGVPPHLGQHARSRVAGVRALRP